MFAHLLHAVKSHAYLVLALELEGDGDDADGEDAQLLSYGSHNGTGARARTAAHAGGDEHHLGSVLEGRSDGFPALLGILACHLGLGAGAEAGSDLQTVGDGGVLEGLTVGVDGEEGNVLDALVEHVGDGIHAAPADTDDLDDGIIPGRLPVVEIERVVGLGLLLRLVEGVHLGIDIFVDIVVHYYKECVRCGNPHRR